ncbi:MAG: efflux transporter outer membrane subunit [Xanthomonadaceae bacterium]|nr:efflux transporter outer membrane subunit [Xanthomonadaceae bacterium]MDE1962515.1 efflux transporter outer membrane subunit [Xanthomonadaceae bacterium]
MHRSRPHPSPDGAVRSGWRYAGLLLLAGLGGCAVGPDFRPPSPPTHARLLAHPIAATSGRAGVPEGAAQRFSHGGAIPADWWTLFHSAPLDALVHQALTRNHDLKAARAALTVAHETTLAGRGSYFPAVSAGVSASREQDPPGALAPVPSSNAYLYNLFTPQVSVSYVPDVFGLNRRMVESLRAQEDAARYQLIAARITLSANVVNTAVQVASLQAQLDATQDQLRLNRQMLAIVQRQFDKGYASRLDLAAQQSQLAQVNATLPPLRLQLAQQRHALAVLTGQFPGDADAAHFTLDGLTLPSDLPLSLPSELVAQRPDVLQAQANLHAASAAIGVAEAARLPQIELSANAGSTALAINQVFHAGTGFWNVGAAITAPLFQGGALRHQERAARAAYVEAAEQYRGTVLVAFQNVADTLVALQQDADGLTSAASAADAAKVTLDLSQRQWKDGYANYLAVLNAEQAYQQARMTLVQARAARLADTAALYQALGGGWWHADAHTQPPSDGTTHDQ